MPFWCGIAALVLLFPAIVIPLLVSSFGKPAFESIDDLDAANIQSLSILILERPDGGPNIGMPNELFVIPKKDHEAALAPLRKAERVTAETSRGIWLGRIAVTLADGRTQRIMLHRPKQEYDKSRVHRLEVRIGPNQFVGPPVDEFIARIAAIAGLEKPKE